MKHKILKLFSMLILIASLIPLGILVPTIEVMAANELVSLASGGVGSNGNTRVSVPKGAVNITYSITGAYGSNSYKVAEWHCGNHSYDTGPTYCGAETYAPSSITLCNSSGAEVKKFNFSGNTSGTIKLSDYHDVSSVILQSGSSQATSNTASCGCSCSPITAYATSYVSITCMGYKSPQITSNLPSLN